MTGAAKLAQGQRRRLQAITHQTAGDGFEDGGAGIGGVGEAKAAEFDHAGADGRDGRDRLRLGEPGFGGKGNVPRCTLPEGPRADLRAG